MSNEQQTTEATTTTDGAADSQQATHLSATGAEDGGQQQQQAAEGQGTEGQKAEGGKTEGEQQGQKKAEGAPEQYEFTPPEGKEFSPEVIGAFSDVARELNLTNEQAQAAIDKLAPAFAAREAQAMEQAREAWAGEASSDKEFGGEKFTENLSVAKKAVDAFASPELRALLEETGLGNHPEVIRVFYRAGKAISEDTFVAGRGGASQTGDARGLYSKSNLNP